MIEVVKICDKPEWKAQAAAWFSNQWDVPMAGKRECMKGCAAGFKSCVTRNDDCITVLFLV